MSEARPFRFAVQAVKASSAGEWRDLARRVEGLGYSTLFSADHYLDRGPAAQDLGPIAAMATAAAVTDTLRIGCRVFCVDYHQPAALAKEVATLDLLSEGRLELGIGAGWSEQEYGMMGIPFAAAARRVDKLEEMIAFLKAYFSGEKLDVHGAYVDVAGYPGLPRPVQQPHPPFMIGGSRKRVLSLAGREADIVSFANVGFEPVNDAGLTPDGEAVRRCTFRTRGGRRPLARPRRRELAVLRRDHRRSGPAARRTGRPIQDDARCAARPPQRVDGLGRHRDRQSGRTP